MGNRKLVSTITGQEYSFDRIKEFGNQNDPLEVRLENIENALIKEGQYLWQRFDDFLPFSNIDESISLGEGNTALIKADRKLLDYVNLKNLYLKDETCNPTGSFKDRGSLFCIAMAKEMGEKVTATISTGNMGHSIAAYGARSNLKVVVFVSQSTPRDKLMPIALNGAKIFKIIAPDYAEMKKQLLGMADKLNLRIVSGNGPIRVEGYKLTAFEMFEQMNGNVPDYIAVPTSACGHIRGIFKGYRELKQAGLIDNLPNMVVVQARNNSPIVKALKQGRNDVVPFTNFHTVAEAITTGNPLGGREIIDKTRKFGWLAEDVSEKEIIDSQKVLAQSGFFVQPASATSLYAVKK
ncbi:MAG TPA: threonine synthase, partial [bacterium]|nr:threonine synthase [bacterium]